MLGTKDILMGASTSTPELNDFARLIATELPTHEIGCQDLAQAVISAAFEAKNHRDSLRVAYPQLYGFIKEGGNMRLLSAKIVEVIEAGANATYAESYKAVSAIFGN